MDRLPPDSQVTAAWIAVDVGTAAPPNTRIGQKTFNTADDPNAQRAKFWDGSFTVSRPTNGWPVGSYKAEIHVNGRLVKTLPFRID